MLRCMSGVNKLDRIWDERIIGTTRVGEISKTVWACIEKRRRICGQESDGDGGAGERRRGRPKRRNLDNTKHVLSDR